MSRTFDELVSILKTRMDFPDKYKDPRHYHSYKIGESHYSDRDSHELMNYTTEFGIGDGYTMELTYNYCEDCRQIRNKYMVILDKQGSRAYKHWITKHGKSMVGVSALMDSDADFEEVTDK